jgi:hypothetical protein
VDDFNTVCHNVPGGSQESHGRRYSGYPTRLSDSLLDPVAAGYEATVLIIARNVQ